MRTTVHDYIIYFYGVYRRRGIERVKAARMADENGRWWYLMFENK